MYSFTDTAGHKYTIDITIGAVKRVRNELGIELGTLYAKNEEGQPLTAQLELDPCLLIDVVYVLVKKQADTYGLTDVDFGESIGGASGLAARESFWRALANFFREYGQEANARAVEKHLQLTAAAMQKALEEVEAINVGEYLDSFGTSSTTGPESLESTPTPSQPTN